MEGPLKFYLFNSDIIKMCEQLCGEVNNLWLLHKVPLKSGHFT
jgi:hypothetical protein